MDAAEQERFAKACTTSVGYLRKVMSTNGRLGESIAIAIERESNKQVMAEDIRPDCKELFDFLRNSGEAA